MKWETMGNNKNRVFLLKIGKKQEKVIHNPA
jgi:hypothetical protein